MSLQFIIGSSGAGKSYFAYERVIRESMEHPERNYYIIVPEQFTMQTQKTLVEMHPGKGILNIDILSFERLAYRVFEETGGDNRKVLEDTGKSMVLQKMVQQHRKELAYLGSQMNKPGYLDEVKSLVSEFMQYDIREENLAEMKEKAKNQPLLEMKLKDVGILYQSFREFLKGHYMTGEEVMDVLLKQLPFSEKLKGAEFLFDGFTGFTPIQVNVLRELLVIADRISVTVTMDEREDAFSPGKPYQLFFMSKQMIRTLAGLSRDLEDPVYLKPSGQSRFAQAPALQFLEKNIFRYRKGVYAEEQQEIKIFTAPSPLEEMREAARRMSELVRTCGYRYGEIAVITGNLEEYARLAAQVFEEADIPYFIDEKHSVMMNPFVEYLRAAMEMAVQGFPYESVFRYLRCGMSEVTREQADKLENYVLALGIRGYKKWSEKWVRVYRGMEAEKIQELNEIREIFAEEVRELAQGFGSGKKTVEEYCRILYEFIQKSNVWQKLKRQERKFKESGDKAMEKEYNQIYGIVMDLLDKMVEILGEETVNRQEFRQLLESGLSQAKVALIPPSIDQVMVGDMERSRLKEIKALFFVGVNEGNIPKSTQTGGILSELDRDFFQEQGVELAPGPKELMNMQRFYLYLNMTKPSMELYISYTRLDSEKKAAQPSYLIGILKGMFPELVVTETEDVEQLLDISSRQSALDYLLSNEVDDRWCEIAAAVMLYDASVSDAGDGNEVDDKEFTQKNSVERLINARFEHYSKDPISRNVARSIYGRHMEGSITRFEQFARCAYAHFLNYGLRLTEREESGFTSLDMGNIYHEALERYSKKLDRESTDWFSVTDAKRDELAMEAINEVIDEYAGFGIFDTAESQHSISHMKAVFKQTVWALTTQIRRGSFVPERFEFSFYESLDMANDVTVDIKGRVDRTDTYTDEGRLFVKVLDYKSGNTVFDLVKLYYGTQLQLAVYMDAVMEQKKEALKQVSVEPGGMLYYHIDDPVIDLKDVTPGTELSEEEINQMILKKLKPDGLINSDEKAYRGMDRDFEKSSDVIPVTLKKDQTPAAGSKVANAEEFDVITRFAREKLREIGREIYDGNVDVNPIKNKKIDSCAYCTFQAICRYDSRIPGFSERSFNGDNKEDVLDKMRTQIAAAEHKACYGDNNIKP